MNNILITGGSGMVGTALKNVFPDAAYPTRKELDLRNDGVVRAWLNNGNWDNGPRYDAVIHLAARVGGVNANTKYVGDFFSENLKMNHNLLHNCMLNEIPKVVSLLSTCVYPDEVIYPLTEDQIHNGEPHHSNFGYAYAKRMLDIESRAYRQQYSCNYICAVPNNLYGKNDNYDLENSHVIAALTRKIWEAKINNIPFVEVWGDGSPLREFTYSEDIAKILIFLLENYDEPEPINIGNPGEHSIKEVVGILCDTLQYDGKVRWNKGMPSGQQRKPSSNKKLLDLGWKEEYYTPFKKGIEETCRWFVNNHSNMRGA